MIASEQILAVEAEDGVTRIAPVDEGARKVLLERLFTPGELLRLNQLDPDERILTLLESKQLELFDSAA